ncbi:hypothetical protein BCR36DRAFT_124403 [Piromyces finnis]|uniref:Uncharacterized protein n=1 Tax=Piromyces finnis TaxID=1754191 RepID=A0A1Y1V0H2_9FUNG|nr:hypothetical protein BCR36DRAFT_124403 [Piromyces finnis]|eukprot:ORX44649.1 hypothetical protein BCR36DRAFT_124403 [Piromyces finnis]
MPQLLFKLTDDIINNICNDQFKIKDKDNREIINNSDNNIINYNINYNDKINIKRNINKKNTKGDISASHSLLPPAAVINKNKTKYSKKECENDSNIFQKNHVILPKINNPKTMMNPTLTSNFSNNKSKNEDIMDNKIDSLYKKNLEKEVRNRLKLLANNTGNINEKYIRHNRINTHFHINNSNNNRKISSPLLLESNETKYLDNSSSKLSNYESTKVNSVKKAFNEDSNESIISVTSSKRVIFSSNEDQDNSSFKTSENPDFMNSVKSESFKSLNRKITSNYYLLNKKLRNDGIFNDGLISSINNSYTSDNNSTSIIFDKNLFNKPIINVTKNEKKNNKSKLFEQYSYMINNGILKYQYDNNSKIDEEGKKREMIMLIINMNQR